MPRKSRPHVIMDDGDRLKIHIRRPQDLQRRLGKNFTGLLRVSTEYPSPTEIKHDEAREPVRAVRDTSTPRRNLRSFVSRESPANCCNLTLRVGIVEGFATVKRLCL